MFLSRNLKNIAITPGSRRFKKHVYSVASFHEENINPFGKFQWFVIFYHK